MFDYFKPTTIDEALSLMARLDEAAFIAGGTDVMVLMRHGTMRTKNLISLRNIDSLASIDTSLGLRIGSGTTHSAIQSHPIVRERYSALFDAVCRIGSRQIRNVATIGGNICTAAPSADTACPLLVLDADVSLVGPEGPRIVRLEDFFTGPGKTVLSQGEILKEFIIPDFGRNTGSAYIKHTRRQAMELPILGVAARINLISDEETALRCRDVLCTIQTISEVLHRFEDEDLRCGDVRIAMGVVAPKPIRARKAEDFLRGKRLTAGNVDAAAAIAVTEASPRDSVRGEAWYRKEMIQVLVRRSLMKAIDRVIRPDDTIYPERLW